MCRLLFLILTVNLPVESKLFASSGGLQVFCLAPAVYGKNRSESEISEKIQQKINYYSLCYSQNFDNKSATSFKVRFRFIIKADGSIADISTVFTGTKNNAFIECLIGMFKQIYFQKIDPELGDTVVEQSILFKVQS